MIACPPIHWEYKDDAKRDAAYDDDLIEGLRAGCVRHYGEGACLIKVIKTGQYSFHVICRRNK
jgi:hypothetical protein